MTCWSQLSGRHHRSEQPEHQRSKPSPREPAYLTLTSARRAPGRLAAIFLAIYHRMQCPAS
jgi:hypothetical protein